MPAYHIPNGPKNIISLFPAANFQDIEEYFLELKNSAGEVIATTSPVTIESACDDCLRLFFMNSCGMIDAINAQLLSKDIDTKSDSMIRPLSVPFQMSKGGASRVNISAGTILSLMITDVSDADLPLLQEMIVSPYHWLSQRNSDDYIPVIMQTTKIQTLKNIDERYDYNTLIEVRLSNDLIIQRP